MPFSIKVLSETVIFLTLACMWLTFATATSRLQQIKRPHVKAEMQVALPRFIQVVLAGGDRYLATNVSVFRALTVSTDNAQSDRFAVQSVVQLDASWLNPRNEDNYYLATAILSWNGHVDSAQQILKAATESRPFDMLPPFYYAFNEYYFRHAPMVGAKWLKIAASHSDNEQDRINLQKIAARWAEKGQDRGEALRLLNGMATQSHHPSLRTLLLQRAERIKHLIVLDEAVEVYRNKFHHPPKSLEALVESNLLRQLPHDPLGQGYTLDPQGIPQVITPIKK